MATRLIGRRLEIACWVLGIALLGIYFGVRTHGEIERRQAIAAFTDALKDTPAELRAVGEIAARPAVTALFADTLTPDLTLWAEGRIRAYAVSINEPANADGLATALLRIPRVALEVPVYADTSERNLNRGAGLVEGTAWPDSDGNVAIAAHRDGYFRVLENVAVGDVVQLQSLSGQRTYRITELAIVEPTDLWPLHATDEPTVTLITCYPFYFAGNAPQRFIVRAVAVGAGRAF